MKNIRKCSPQDLMRAGLDPKLFPPEKLLYWLVRPRHPVLASDDPLAKMLIEAMLKGEAVEIIYVGGSKPGSPRSVKVSLVFQHDPGGRVYVSGFCPERGANRVFSLDLIMVVQTWN
jgi:predicted DNA-binding transcriptional regulator YafY